MAGVYTVKYLVYGEISWCIIDQHLTWKCHVDYVLRRVHEKLYSINRLRPLTDNVMKILYQAHILPINDNCDAVWVPTNSSLLKRLERDTQRVHSRFVSSIRTNCSVFKLSYPNLATQISYCY